MRRLSGHGSALIVKVDPLQVFGRQSDAQCSYVLFKIFHALRPGDGHDVRPLGQDPGQGQLGGGAILLGRDRLEAGDQIEVPLQVLPLEARVLAPEITLVQKGRLLDRPR